MNATPSDDWRHEKSDTVIRLPEQVSPAFNTLIAAAAPVAAAALRRQVLSSDDEDTVSEEERGDPLGEARYCVTPYLVHQYRNRVLLLGTVSGGNLPLAQAILFPMSKSERWCPILLRIPKYRRFSFRAETR